MSDGHIIAVLTWMNYTIRIRRPHPLDTSWSCSVITFMGDGQWRESRDNPTRMEALGLTDYALKRYALAGNPSDWIARIEALALAGATKLWVGLGGGDLDRQQRTMRLLGEQIMARFV